jgi:hypothetical protein
VDATKQLATNAQMTFAEARPEVASISLGFNSLN